MKGTITRITRTEQDADPENVARGSAPTTSTKVIRAVSLDNELLPRLASRWSTVPRTLYRPVNLTETVEIENGEIVYYVIKLYGPKRTLKGEDHKSQSLDESWDRGHRFRFASRPDDPHPAGFWTLEALRVPDEIKALLVGAERLAAWPWEGTEASIVAEAMQATWPEGN